MHDKCIDEVQPTMPDLDACMLSREPGLPCKLAAQGFHRFQEEAHDLPFPRVLFWLVNAS